VNTSRTVYSGEFAPWSNAIPGWNAGDPGTDFIVYTSPNEIQTHWLLDAIGEENRMKLDRGREKPGRGYPSEPVPTHPSNAPGKPIQHQKLPRATNHGAVFETQPTTASRLRVLIVSFVFFCFLFIYFKFRPCHPTYCHGHGCGSGWTD